MIDSKKENLQCSSIYTRECHRDSDEDCGILHSELDSKMLFKCCLFV